MCEIEPIVRQIYAIFFIVFIHSRHKPLIFGKKLMLLTFSVDNFVEKIFLRIKNAVKNSINCTYG